MKVKLKIMSLMLAAALASSTMQVQASENNDSETVNADLDTESNMYAKASCNTDILSSSINGSVIGTMAIGAELKVNCILDNGYTEVSYNDYVGYVESSNCTYINKVECKNIVKVKEGTKLYTDESVETLDSDNVGKLFSGIGTWAYIELDNRKFYVKKDDIEILEGLNIVVDISDQELTLYNNTNVDMAYPVISGSDRTPTVLGDFEIYKKKYKYTMHGIGENGKPYTSYADIFMAFYKGYAIHDAFWRTHDEYADNEYYHEHGSHGCLNSEYENVSELDKRVDVHTRVLVIK